MVKFLAFFSTLSLVCVLIGVAAYIGFGTGKVWRSQDAAAVVKEVRAMNELVTVKYTVEKVVGLKEEKSPVGEESILLLVRGRVLAGVNLAELRPEDVLFPEGNGVRIRLPAARIESAYLDEKYTKVWDRRITWWTPWVTPDPDLEHKARMQAVDDMQREAGEMGILGEAQRNAEFDIKNLLQSVGIKRVVFAYGD